MSKKSPLFSVVVLVLAAIISVTVTYAQEAPQPVQAETFGNAQILEMHNLGFADEVLVAKIRSVQGEYDTNLETLIALKREGVSNVIITEMLRTQQNPNAVTTLAPIVPPQAQSDPNDPMAQYEPGVYLASDDGKLIQLEPGKLTRKDKQMSSAAVLFNPFSPFMDTRGEETCYFNDKEFPITNSRRPEFTFYLAKKRSMGPYVGSGHMFQFSRLPVNYIVVAKLEREDNRPIFKYKPRDDMGKRLIRFKVEEVYKNVYKATPESDLLDGDYAIGIFDFDLASSSGFRGEGTMAGPAFTQCLLPFTVRESVQEGEVK